MDSSAQSQVVILYHPSSITPEQVTEAICRDLQTNVTPFSVILKEKDRGVLAFIELSTETAQKLIDAKKITIGDTLCYPKRFYCDHQIFINKLPLSIEVADVKEYFGQFGSISNIEIVVVTHNFENGKSIDFRHCYIMFANRESADKVIMHPKRHIIKKEEIKTCRTYGIAEGDDTDKKIFVKIDPKCEKPEQMQGILQDKFSQFGKLREKIKIEEGKEYSTATVVMTSAEGGQKAYKNLKDIQIEKFKITMRPHASELALFAPGLKANVTEDVISSVFSKFGRISACTLAKKRDSMVQSATINFANQDDAKLALVQYQSTPEIISLYAHKPFLTIHMNIKERKQFSNFNRKSKPNNRPPPQPFPMQMNLPPYQNMPPQNFPNQGFPPQGRFNQPNFVPQRFAPNQLPVNMNLEQRGQKIENKEM